jgi:hypothetical protein
VKGLTGVGVVAVGVVGVGVGAEVFVVVVFCDEQPGIIVSKSTTMKSVNIVFILDFIEILLPALSPWLILSGFSWDSEEKKPGVG